MAEVYIPEDLTSEQKQQNGEYKVPKFTKENGKLTIFHHLLFSLQNNNVQIEQKDRGAHPYISFRNTNEGKTEARKKKRV